MPNIRQAEEKLARQLELSYQECRSKVAQLFLPEDRVITEVPVITIAYVVDTMEYVLYSVYKNGTTMKPLARSPDFNNLITEFNKHV